MFPVDAPEMFAITNDSALGYTQFIFRVQHKETNRIRNTDEREIADRMI